MDDVWYAYMHMWQHLHSDIREVTTVRFVVSM